MDEHRTYNYRALAFRNGEKVRDEIVSINGVEVYKQTCIVGEHGLLTLLDRWNRNGILGIEKSGVIYVYIKE